MPLLGSGRSSPCLAGVRLALPALASARMARTAKGCALVRLLRLDRLSQFCRSVPPHQIAGLRRKTWMQQMRSLHPARFPSWAQAFGNEASWTRGQDWSAVGSPAAQRPSRPGVRGPPVPDPGRDPPISLLWESARPPARHLQGWRPGTFPEERSMSAEDEALASRLQMEADWEAALEEPPSGDDEYEAWSMMQELQSALQFSPSVAAATAAMLRPRRNTQEALRRPGRAQPLQGGAPQLLQQRLRPRSPSPPAGDDFYSRLWGMPQSEDGEVQPRQSSLPRRPQSSQRQLQLPPRLQPLTSRPASTVSSRPAGRAIPSAGQRRMPTQQRASRPSSRQQSTHRSSDSSPEDLRRGVQQSAEEPTGRAHFAVPGANVEAVASSTVVVVFRATEAKAGNEEHKACTICCESFADGEQLRLLPCLHRYHLACIDRWLAQSRTCPVCKYDIAGSTG
ncbi:unnamed protein product [Polarella glacialis]|uniref:RING-type E3 ubiquitin transferase n=1 Tax=Polarella glacialis TaxID=89957 RepID=A0A813IQB2_POLGL|nr:unnamed protein product [Polarella glacialis]